MSNIYEFFWTDKDKQSYAVCEDCNSVCCFDVATNETNCVVCQRINRVIQSNEHTQHICKRCCFHVSMIIEAPVFSECETVRECARCHTRQTEVNELIIAHDCPTCFSKETVQDYYIDIDSGAVKFHCHHCKTNFHSYNSTIVQPEFCSICNKNAVQLIIINRIAYKQCTECFQLYNKNNELLDENLQLININDDDDIQSFDLNTADEYTSTQHKLES